MSAASNRWVEGWLRQRRSTRLEMRGWSMAPAICDGDWLTVAPLFGPVRVGDVVVMRWNERLVTHRVVSLCDGRAVTRGDACMALDPPIALDELLGRVVAVEPARRGLARRARVLVGRWLRHLPRRPAPAVGKR